MRRILKALLLLLAILAVTACTPRYIFIPIPPVEDDSTPYDADNPESFAVMLQSTGQVRLVDDMTITELPIAEGKDYEIDLNGQTLAPSTSDNRLTVGENADVVIENGTFDISIPAEDSPSKAFIAVSEGGSLTMRGVTYTAGQTGIFINTNNSTVTIENSTIIANGAYAIGTNAAQTITGSALYSPTVGLLFNIPGNLTISNSSISGGDQAVIARSGNVTISGSTLTLNNDGNISSLDQYLSGDWGTGNAVPVAALIVGNRGSIAYEPDGEMTCTLADSRLVSEVTGAKLVYVASDNTNTVNFISADCASEAAKDGNHYKGDESTLNICTAEGEASLVK